MKNKLKEIQEEIRDLNFLRNEGTYTLLEANRIIENSNRVTDLFKQLEEEITEAEATSAQRLESMDLLTKQVAELEKKQSYLHIAYADSADGTINFNRESGKYIGVYTGTSVKSCPHPDTYKWTEVVQEPVKSIRQQIREAEAEFSKANKAVCNHRVKLNQLPDDIDYNREMDRLENESDKLIGELFELKRKLRNTEDK